jgi:hypothetical protein
MCHLEQFIQVQYAIPLPQANDLLIATPAPVNRVTNHSGANHIQIDVSHAIPEMGSILYEGAVVTLVPECAAAPSVAVVIGGEFAVKVPHEKADGARAPGGKHQVGVVGSETVVQQANLEAAGRPPQSLPVLISIDIEAQEIAAIVAAVSEVVYLPRQEDSCGSWHRQYPDL